jgi:hypothetical protein
VVAVRDWYSISAYRDGVSLLNGYPPSLTSRALLIYGYIVVHHQTSKHTHTHDAPQRCCLTSTHPFLFLSWGSTRVPSFGSTVRELPLKSVICTSVFSDRADPREWLAIRTTSLSAGG